MNYSSNKSSADLKCIWMGAGIINYKLCDREFQCEECEFNKVMQGMLPHDHVEANRAGLSSEEKSTANDINFRLINGYLYKLFADCTIHLDRYYHPSHFWFLPESDNIVKVGIDKILLKIIAPIDKIVLPKIGEVFQQNQLAALIVRKAKTLSLYSPIKGKVVKINHQFSGDCAKPSMKGDSYCFKLEGDGLREKVQQLCGAVPRLETFSRDLSIVRKYLEKAFNRNTPANVGLTFADGGLFQECLEKVVGEKNFQELMDELFTAMSKSLRK